MDVASASDITDGTSSHDQPPTPPATPPLAAEPPRRVVVIEEMGSDEDMSDDEDARIVDVTAKEAASLHGQPPIDGASNLNDQPFDVFELLALQIARSWRAESHLAVSTLVSLSEVSSTLRGHMRDATRAWDALSAWRYALRPRRRLDPRVAFPFVSPASAPPIHEPRTDIELIADLCLSTVDSSAAKALVGSSVEWCTGLCRRHLNRAAYSRPTVGPLAEAPTSRGGLANFACLASSSSALGACLHVSECDISDLPNKVGMICLPSNEMLVSPGWGALHDVYMKAGPELATWLQHQEADALRRNGAGPGGRPRFILESGDAVSSPAFGNINADYLCHAVGISFYNASSFQQSCASADAETRSHAESELHSAAVKQVHLIRRCFALAAEAGVSSVAIPAISAGKRGFPPLLAAAITLSIAAHEVLASRGTLEVHVVAYGDENHLDAFECARQAAITRLVEVGA